MKAAGIPVPQIMHLFAYKPDRTDHLSAFTQGVMRGPSPLTPGMRELQLWTQNEGSRETFDDVLEVAQGCHFTDCRHRDEPRRGGEPVALTPTEMRLLLEFSSAPGTVLSRDKLLERVWDYGWGGDTRVVDVHVQRLRTKVGQDRIETVRGFGYKLKA